MLTPHQVRRLRRRVRRVGRMLLDNLHSTLLSTLLLICLLWVGASADISVWHSPYLSWLPWV